MRAQRGLRCERGSVLVTGLLLSLALLMITGAAVDIGHAFIVRRELYSIADDAALTGSQALDLDSLHAGKLRLDPARARAAALAAIARSPGEAAQASATGQDVSVSLKRRFPTILLRLVGLGSLTVSAHSTAAPRRP